MKLVGNQTSVLVSVGVPAAVLEYCGLVTTLTKLPRTLLEQLLNRRLGHGQLIDVGFQPTGEIYFDLILPAAVDLTRGVDSFTQPLLAKLIAQLDQFARLDDLLSQVRRHKDDAILPPQHNIPRHDRDFADADRAVDTG